MAQPKPSQTPASRAGLNREQVRRGMAPTPPAAARPTAPLVGGGSRSRRGGSPLTFVKDVRSELRKVVWPTPRETLNLTIVVISLSVAVGLLLGAFDFIFQELFRWLLALSGGG